MFSNVTFLVLFQVQIIKLFSFSIQLSMNFKMLINSLIAKINGNFRFESLKLVIYSANKCYNANICWHLRFNIYEQDKFQAQLS